ncbi:lipopolysaccharide transport periplasmic protein LptA [Luteimonas sp. SJ-92]|uniref:Lipopolysaccharide export system protein LptA n=1 Tax=Luteimonas salinisoli TaxID=2752307 RepID=A0A853JF47_9GAMM|nr:lipopolysaccharide transport periplasmic protein LptA [Luteimonas salinisoli]NZA27475.1 lipopolysaccharide transport periplasmic protein LptA [Luteimonas salinisoli]
MSPRAASALLALATALALSPPAAEARKSDRNQPMDIDAGRHEGVFDDSAPTVLSRGVTITQGTLDIRADRADIHSRGGDITRAVLTGAPAVMRQEMDDGAPMTARARRIDYDMRTEVVTLTGDAFVEQPRGSMKSQRIVYNMQTGRVESGGDDAGRVQMRFEPRNAAPQDGD